MSNPPKILNPVVRPIAIDVIDNRERVWVRNECKSNKAMNLNCPAYSIFASYKSWITLMV